MSRTVLADNMSRTEDIWVKISGHTRFVFGVKMEAQGAFLPLLSTVFSSFRKAYPPVDYSLESFLTISYDL